MADANVSRLGQIKNSGDDYALFLKTYAGEVVTSFQDNYMLDGRITTRNIDSGKSASFPTLGNIGSGYHVPGTEILGRKVEANEIIVTLDPMLISDAFIASIDEAMNHYDVRSEYTRQQGLELAKQRQKNELRCVIEAARQTVGPVSGQPGGARVTDTAMATDPAKLAAAFKTARQTSYEKNIPVQDTCGVLMPAQYFLLTENTDLVNRDYNDTSHGDLNDAVIYSVARYPLVMTNHFPNADDTANAEVLAKYQGDYSATVAVAFHKSAAATLKLRDLALEDIYQGGKQGTLMLAKYALGHGPLRAGAAVEIATA